MIIRERDDAFVMIEQNHHATLSGQLYDHISQHIKLEEEINHLAVREAIYLHDIGWSPFDLSPIWNDENARPYDFITYPNTIKTVLYQYGINKVAETNDYAALLCSEHYTRFLEKDSHPLSQQFVKKERKRQKALINSFSSFNQDTFLTHYEILQFFDNFSLYICLHEINATPDDIHYFFKRGIALPALYGGGKLNLSWEEQTILLDRTLFQESITIKLQQKVVSKRQIKEEGLQKAWNNTDVELVPIKLK